MLGFSRLKSKGNGGLGFPKPPFTTLDVLLEIILRSISTVERYSHDRKLYFLPYESW